MTAELRTKMADAITDQMLNLSRLRHADQHAVLHDMTQTFKENAGASVGTAMESYWLLMVDVAQHEVVPR